MKRALCAAAALGLFASTSVHAAVIVKNIAFDASDFTTLFGAPTTAPVDPVHLNFTVKFDNSADVAFTSSGLTINSFNLPYTAKYAYSQSSDILTLATMGSINSCSHPASSFCTFISNVSSSAPKPFFFEQSPASGGGYTAHTFGAFTATPEPATWAMMIAGFGLVGAAMRRARKTGEGRTVAGRPAVTYA